MLSDTFNFNYLNTYINYNEIQIEKFERKLYHKYISFKDKCFIN